MFGKLLSRLTKPNLTEENVIKQMKNWKLMFLDRPGFAEKYVGVEIFKKREDLREEFLKRFPEEMKMIVSQNNPVYFLWSKIIDNTKALAIPSTLLREEFSKSRDAICESINRGMKYLAEHWANTKTTYEEALSIIERIETFFAEPWSYRKVVHECSWAEVESLALRHMQVFLFRKKVSYDDWWSLYRKAYEEYITKAYRLIANNLEKPEGWPHPLWIAMTNETLTGMEDKVLKAVEQNTTD